METTTTHLSKSPRKASDVPFPDTICYRQGLSLFMLRIGEGPRRRFSILRASQGNSLFEQVPMICRRGTCEGQRLPDYEVIAHVYFMEYKASIVECGAHFPCQLKHRPRCPTMLKIDDTSAHPSSRGRKSGSFPEDHDSRLSKPCACLTCFLISSSVHPSSSLYFDVQLLTKQ